MIGSVTKRYKIEKILASIRIASAPTTTSYTEGDALDLTGLSVAGLFTTGEESISGYATSPADGDTLTESDTSVTVSYTYKGITKTASIPITVEAIPNSYEITAKASGFSYGFEKCNNTTDSYYFSGLSKYDSNWWRSTNYQVQNSTAGCLITLHLHKAAAVSIDVVDYQNRSSYNYGTLGAADGSALSSSYSTNYDNTESATVKWSGYSNHQSGGQTISYGTLPAGDHTIYVRYRKSGSRHTANDRLYFRVNIE